MNLVLVPAIGRFGLTVTRGLGGLALVVGRTVRALPRLSPRELLRSLVHFGWGSLPLALLVAFFTGGILVLVTIATVQRFGARSLFGWAAGYALLREFGPLFIGLVMAGRIGARNAAELASMSIGGQLEGLRGLGVDPFALLVGPRLVASAIAVAAIGAVAVLVSVLVSALFGRIWIGVELGSFFRSFDELLGWKDLAAAVVKMVAFGSIIALVSTHRGLAARGGAQAVGRAAAQAVVASSAFISFADWVLTMALSEIL